MFTDICLKTIIITFCLQTHACNSRPNSSTVFMQAFAGNRINWILSTSDVPVPLDTPHKHLRGSLENCSLESTKFHGVSCLRKKLLQAQVLLLLWFPHEILPSEPEQETLYLFFVKKDIGFFKWRSVTARAYTQKKIHSRDMPGGLSGLCNTSPWAEQFSLTELFRDIYSE